MLIAPNLKHAKGLKIFMKKQTKKGRPLDGKERKVSCNVYLEPKVRDKIIKKYGSLTKAIIASLTPNQ